jgi:hypothetical protein
VAYRDSKARSGSWQPESPPLVVVAAAAARSAPDPVDLAVAAAASTGSGTDPFVEEEAKRVRRTAGPVSIRPMWPRCGRGGGCGRSQHADALSAACHGERVMLPSFWWSQSIISCLAFQVHALSLGHPLPGRKALKAEARLGISYAG